MLAHHHTSRPSGRWGTAGIRCPAASSTVRVAASSSAIWQPEFAAPTTRTLPGGMVAGLRYSTLWSWRTPGSSSLAMGGMNGTWKGPVATTTCRASHAPAVVLAM